MKLQFWYDLASNYSYLSAMRIEELAHTAGVEIEWRPFLLGPIFKAQGWDTSPFNIYPAKGRYMIRDMERITADRGLPPFVLPKPFPSRSLLAVRVALLLDEEGATPAFSRAAFKASFCDGRDIGEETVLSGLLSDMGLDAGRIIAGASQDRIKTALRVRTEEAQRAGIFGAPTFVTEAGEIFWGDDRLEQAISWTSKH